MGYANNDWPKSPEIKRNLAPGSVKGSWTTGGQTYQLTDDGAGKLAGAGSGEVSYATGALIFNPQPTPAPADGDYTVEFEDWQGEHKRTDSVTLATTGPTSFTPSAPMREGSVRVDVKLRRLTTTRTPDGGTPAHTYTTEDVTLTDDGAGNLSRGKGGAVLGTVNYATGELSFDPRQVRSYTIWSQKNGLRGLYWDQDTASAPEEYADTTASIEWTDPADPVAVRIDQFPIPGLAINLTPTSARAIVPGSLIFSVGSTEYRDQNGAIIKDWNPVTNAGTAVGSIDYTTGQATLTDYPANTPTNTPVTLIACTTTASEKPASRTVFRTAGAPLREGSLIVNATDIDGNPVTGRAQTDGSITGTGIESGQVDTQTGLVYLEWTRGIMPSSARYSAVAYTYLPLDADLVGLDATRLPSDGRVPQFNLGDVVVLTHTNTHPVPTATPGQTVSFDRQNQAEIWVEGANGRRLSAEQYTTDPEAGTLTFSESLALLDDDANAVTEPLTVYERIEDMGLATDVQIGGQISLNIPLSQDYPAGSIASAAILYGDIRARVHTQFHQASWTGTWSDDRIGNDTTAKYNWLAHPFEITNQGGIKERWAIRFTSSSAFEVIGETVGVVASGNTATDCAPVNGATGAPYFMIRKEGWGSGWVSGNTLRFNSDGGQAPFWIARTVVAGRATEENDQFSTQNRGDAD